GVLFILLVLPGGLGGLFYDARDAVLRVIARRRDIVVPSLLADMRVDDDGRPVDISEPVPLGDRLRAVAAAPGRAVSERAARVRARLRPSTDDTQIIGDVANLLEVRDLELS